MQLSIVNTELLPPDLSSETSFSSVIPVFSGPYSVVLRGECSGVPVAIKILRPVNQVSLHAMRRKVLREKAIWYQMKHPNILPLCGQIESVEMVGPFGALITPWCKNGDISAFLGVHGSQLTFEQRMTMWLGLLKGVQYLHGRSPVIIHGDLKPGNILLDDDLNPQICDFGLSRLLLESGHSGMTTTSDHTGTDRYLAYEIVMTANASLLTTASDVWALGCIGIQILFNQIPYHHRRNNRFGEIFQDIRAGIPPAYPSAFFNQSGKDLWGVLKLCWRVEPGTRPTAGEILGNSWIIYHDIIKANANLDASGITQTQA